MKIKHYQPLTYITFSIVGITVLAGILLSSCDIFNSTSALTQTSTANAAIRVRPTCSMTATIDSGNEHTATMINGQYKEDIGLTTMKTFCNDSKGYAIYAIGYTGGDAGVTAGTNTVLHSSALGSEYDIITGTATNGLDNGDKSNWAMKINAVDGIYKPNITNNYNNFSLVPRNYTKIASYPAATTSTINNGIGSSIETTYAVYISNTQTPGTYTGQVKYILVHPNTATPNTYIMQEIAEWKDNLFHGEQVTAIDNRDGNVYTVSLMDDGDVWMTQNLDLCIGCNGTDPLTSANTDLNTYRVPGHSFTGYTHDDVTGLITWTPTASTLTGKPAYITSATGTAISGWLDSYTTPSILEGGDRYAYPGARYNSLAECISVGHTDEECAHYHVGNYYNWSASVAMDTSYYMSHYDNYVVAPNSICPKGWRLPNGLTKEGAAIVQSDFNAMFISQDITSGIDLVGSANVGWIDNGSTNIALEPIYLARFGRVINGSLDSFGSAGFYWSSTLTDSSQTAYSISFYTSQLSPASKTSKQRGYPVRCIAR